MHGADLDQRPRETRWSHRRVRRHECVDRIQDREGNGRLAIYPHQMPEHLSVPGGSQLRRNSHYCASITLASSSPRADGFSRHELPENRERTKSFGTKRRDRSIQRVPSRDRPEIPDSAPRGHDTMSLFSGNNENVT